MLLQKTQIPQQSEINSSHFGTSFANTDCWVLISLPPCDPTPAEKHIPTFVLGPSDFCVRIESKSNQKQHSSGSKGEWKQRLRESAGNWNNWKNAVVERLTAECDNFKSNKLNIVTINLFMRYTRNIAIDFDCCCGWLLLKFELSGWFEIFLLYFWSILFVNNVCHLALSASLYFTYIYALLFSVAHWMSIDFGFIHCLYKCDFYWFLIFSLGVLWLLPATVLLRLAQSSFSLLQPSWILNSILIWFFWLNWNCWILNNWVRLKCNRECK